MHRPGSLADPTAHDGVELLVCSGTAGPVLVKQATGASARARLAREARLLTLARHPGVVELLRRDDTPERLRLEYPFLGAHTLATGPSGSPERAAGIIAALAETVAALHDLGIVHGRITADHVVCTPAGNPVLIGFGHARIRGTAPAGHEPEPDPEPADDVAALGTLLRVLVLQGPDEHLVVPEHRWARGRRGDAVARRALLGLAYHATDDDPGRRPGARRFAAAVLAAVPDATLVPTRRDGTDRDTVAPEPTPTAPQRGPATVRPRRRRALTLVLAGLGLGALVAGGAKLSAAEDRPPGAALTPTTPAPVAVGTRPTPADAAPSCAAVPCLPVRPAGLVSHAGRTYAVGSPGDEVLAGPLACDRDDELLAVARPSTGEVFVFDGWAEPGSTRDARVLARLAPGTHLQPTPTAARCVALWVRTPDGGALRLAPPTTEELP